jgi:hypothetical protein
VAEGVRRVEPSAVAGRDSLQTPDPAAGGRDAAPDGKPGLPAQLLSALKGLRPRGFLPQRNLCDILYSSVEIPREKLAYQVFPSTA